MSGRKIAYRRTTMITDAASLAWGIELLKMGQSA
jgi:hypothetical protein